MHKITLAQTLLLSAALGGCASSQEVYNIDFERYGQPPGNAESAIKAYHGQALLNPNSATYASISKSAPLWLRAQLLGGPSYGHLVCASFSVKGKDGTTVEKKDGFFFRGDSVVLRMPDGVWQEKPICN